MQNELGCQPNLEALSCCCLHRPAVLEPLCVSVFTQHTSVFTTLCVCVVCHSLCENHNPIHSWEWGRCEMFPIIIFDADVSHLDHMGYFFLISHACNFSLTLCCKVTHHCASRRTTYGVWHCWRPKPRWRTSPSPGRESHWRTSCMKVLLLSAALCCSLLLTAAPSVILPLLHITVPGNCSCAIWRCISSIL